VPTAKEIFEAMPAQIPAENTAGITHTYLFEIKDVGTWLMDVNDGKLTVTEGEAEADVRIGMSEEVFQKLIARQQNPVTGVMTGKIKVHGDMTAARKLGQIFGQ
jgi:putative sterol carrier protein